MPQSNQRQVSKQEMTLPDEISERTLYQLKNVRESVIGRSVLFTTPFGQRMMTYCDYVASGRSLTFVEKRIRRQVLPMYANTHTENSASGSATGALRESSRSMILQACGGTVSDHVVIFTGTGASGAIDTFARILFQSKKTPGRNGTTPKTVRSTSTKRVVVITGHMEHHSNILIWRDSGAKVIQCQQTQSGAVDLEHAATLLRKYRSRSLVLGSFSAASNIDGTLTDPKPLVELFHRFGAYIAFDYAAAAPYVDINLQESGADAIFISTHKFVGGPGTPGVLVCKREIVAKNTRPHRPAGGTVLLVSDDTHVYLQNLVEREEGGTPDIIGAIRAGFVFQVKQDIGAANIHLIETSLLEQCMQRLRDLQSLVVLGNPEADRLATLSFLVKHGDKFLHPNFVTQVLNDLFGIQSRSGCACAGPYGLKLLGISQAASRILGVTLMTTGDNILKPGFSRVQIPFFASIREITFIVEALEWVATHAWKLLVLYTPNGKTARYTIDEATQGRIRKVMSPEGCSERPAKLPSWEWDNSPPQTEKPLSVHESDMQMHYEQYFADANRLLQSLDDIGPNANDYCNAGIPPFLIWFVQATDTVKSTASNQTQLHVPASAGVCLFMPPITGIDNTLSNRKLLRISRSAITPKECWKRVQVVNIQRVKQVEPSLYTMARAALKPSRGKKDAIEFQNKMAAKLHKLTGEFDCNSSSRSLSELST